MEIPNGPKNRNYSQELLCENRKRKLKEKINENPNQETASKTEKHLLTN